MLCREDKLLTHSAGIVKNVEGGMWRYLASSPVGSCYHPQANERERPLPRLQL